MSKRYFYLQTLRLTAVLFSAALLTAVLLTALRFTARQFLPSLHFLLLLALLTSLQTFVSVQVFAVTPLTLLTEEIPPYAYYQHGKITGASVDIIKALFQQAKIPYVIKILPWKRAYETAKTSSACIFPIQRSQQREALFNWVSPVLISQTAFYHTGKSNVTIRTLSDAIALKIGTYRGSVIEEYLVNQGFSVAATSKDSMNINKLLFGRIDLWAADTLSAPYLAKQANINNIKQDLVYFTGLRALACHPLVAKKDIVALRQALKVIYKTGLVNNILTRYKALNHQ